MIECRCHRRIEYVPIDIVGDGTIFCEASVEIIYWLHCDVLEALLTVKTVTDTVVE